MFIRRLCVALAGVLFLLFIAASMSAAGARPAATLDFTPTAYVYLPLVAWYPTPTPYSCPISSGNVYSAGVAYQVDTDDPVRPAWDHADKNISLRGYAPNTDPGLKRELVDYGCDDANAPQFATLFQPARVPSFVDFYRVHDWFWYQSPNPGIRVDPITTPPVTALGLRTTPGEVLRVPESGYDIGLGMEVLVIFADADTVALRYTRDDSSKLAGYTLHVDNICTDPNLLALYDTFDDYPDAPRYQYPNPSYDLPHLPAGRPLGTARGGEVVIAISDAGTFQDPRSCHEWWIQRPGYTGTCPPP